MAKALPASHEGNKSSRTRRRVYAPNSKFDPGRAMNAESAAFVEYGFARWKVFLGRRLPAVLVGSVSGSGSLNKPRTVGVRAIT